MGGSNDGFETALLPNFHRAETADAIRATVLDGIRQIRRMLIDRELFERPA